MKTRFVIALGILSALTLGGCASKTVNSSGLEVMTESAYQKVIATYTERQQSYSGLYNTMDLTATLLNSSAVRAQLEQSARLYQWDREKFQLEQSRAAEKAKNETQIFLSFYTPERKNDDLNKKSTQWRVYLESEGKRWEGQVTKIKQQLSEIQGVYVYHNRFATPYVITFPIGLNTIENKPTKFTLTGPVGFSALVFKARAENDPSLMAPLP